RIEISDDPRRMREDLAPDLHTSGDFLRALDGGALLSIERVGDFFIETTGRIAVTPRPDVETGLLRLYIAGSAMGTLFYQRRQLVLHAATLLRPGGMSAIVGPSGAGKSTLAAHLARAGYAILTDDTLPLSETAQGFVGWPGARLFKLWSDTLADLDQNAAALETISDRYGKYYVPNPTPIVHEPSRLREIIVLEVGDHIAIDPLDGIEALKAVSDNIYRREFIAPLGLNAPYFQMLSRLCETTDAVRLTRPRDRQAIPDTVSALAAHWAAAEPSQ
ncbi:MAG: hypothetical protein AAF293_14935, partial [Pseudomonadota bacterium]